MFRARGATRSLQAAAVLIGLALLAWPAAAQSTGQVRGTVIGPDGKPVANVPVVIEYAEGITRRHETKTNRRGEFVQIGLQPGNYKITAQKDGQTAVADVRIRLGQTENIELALGAAGTPSEEELAKLEARRKALQEKFASGAALSDAGKHDEAIAVFREILMDFPNCAECHANIASVHMRRDDLAEAETAYKQAIAANPNLAGAYSGLASLYNRQGRFDEARAMAAEAVKRGGPAGGGADTAYNQGVIFWNSNQFDEAREQFEQAVQANPAHAQAQFMLGKVYLNLGRVPEAVEALEKYLTLESQGPNADEAREILKLLTG